jgi:carbamoyl-phosphate synthase large subunit
MIYSTVLVTGCGGDIGIGVGRILKMAGVTGRSVGCDVHAEHAGTVFFDRCEIIQRADSRGYFESLFGIIRKHFVDLVIPASEVEMRFLMANNMLDCIERVPVVTANKKALEIGFDKLLTAEFLKSAGLPYPWTMAVREGLPPSLPCIIKKRFGSGGRGVAVVDEKDVECYAKMRPDDIWQEYLQPDDQEYTCGLYRSRSSEIRTIIFRRRLEGGHTVFGEVVHSPSVSDILERLAEAVDLRGSINVQLRLAARGPVIFEINPRFSSTLVFRHLLGFQDVIWSISERANLPIGKFVPPPRGTRFYRGVDEIIFRVGQGNI